MLDSFVPRILYRAATAARPIAQCYWTFTVASHVMQSLGLVVWPSAMLANVSRQVRGTVSSSYSGTPSSTAIKFHRWLLCRFV